MKNNPGVKPGLFVDVTWGVGTLSRSVPRPYRNDETIAAAEILPSTNLAILFWRLWIGRRIGVG